MKRHTVECDCERGGDCTKTTVCAIDSALEAQAEEYEYRIAELEGLISDLECDVHFWKSKVEKAQAKLDAVKALRDELETRELAQYPEHEVSLAWLVIKLDEAIGETE